MTKKAEIFIVGSVLSGTTLLRNVLREHPNLVCPEETHIFRWGQPFATEEFTQLYRQAPAIKNFRRIDKISDKDFKDVLENSMDRKDMMTKYMEKFKQVSNNSTARWFDKSPQNVYGMVLIKSYFPDAKFVHIIRNPLNVVASIKMGHPGLSKNILGSLNYWKEAIMIIKTLKQVWADAIYELKYEDFCQQPQVELTNLLEFIEENNTHMQEAINQIQQAKTDNKSILTKDEIMIIKHELKDLMQEYGYLT